MGVLRLALIAVAAGLNPWLALVITAGLATFTPYAPLEPPFDLAMRSRGVLILVVLAVVLGVEVVAGKLPRLARLTERVDLPAAAGAGALLGLALPSELHSATWPALVLGAALAIGIRLARRGAVAAVNRRLWRFGYVAVGIGANLVAGILAAVAFAIAR